MDILLTSETRKARKDHYCNACEWLTAESASIDYLISEHGLTEDEVKSVKAAAENKWRIKKGSEYSYQTGKQDGEFTTFKAIPEIDEICQKYDMYPEC